MKHVYNALVEGLMFTKVCLEFRYGDVKVLGIQPHQTYTLAYTHCVPNPNPIKGSFNMLFKTHTD